MKTLNQKDALVHKPAPPGLLSPFIACRSDQGKVQTAECDASFVELSQWSERLGNLQEILPWL